MKGSQVDIGSLIDGRYKLVAVIGEGGFGRVYRAQQLATEQSVAIKVLSSGRKDESDIARFEREMKLIAQLKHPNIVGLIDSGRLGKDSFYIVLEHIEGEPLDHYLGQVGALTVRQALRLMTQTLEVLRFAHARGVVHRDFKPGNIMVMEPGDHLSAKVLDFGIAGILEDARTADYRTLTRENAFPGTPAYMAPEQLDGELSLTQKSDLYAWGLVFLECLTGSAIMGQDSALRTILKQVDGAPVPIPDVVRDSPLGPILARATEKDPEQRYPNASSLLVDLETINPLDPAFAELEAFCSEVEPRPLSLDTDFLSGSTALQTQDPPPTPPPTESGEHVDSSQAHEVPATLANAREADLAQHAQSPSPDVSTDVNPIVEEPSPPARPPYAVIGLVVGALALAAVLIALSQKPAPDATETAGAETLPSTPSPEDASDTSVSPSDTALAAAEPRDPLEPCPLGRSRSDTTQGHCCWPGQLWHPQKARCFGPPDHCPPGFLVQGEVCIPTRPEGNGSLIIREIAPPHAAVRLDGQRLGQGAVSLDTLTLGHHSLSIQAPDFSELFVVFELTPESNTFTLPSVTLIQPPPLPQGMTEVPAGEFWMGCPGPDAPCASEEKPGRPVYLDAYAIDRSEVTVEHYAQCVETDACQPAIKPSDPTGRTWKCNWGIAGREHHPVNCVSWYQAQRYCEWAGKRLPTEAEWEKAARGPKDRRAFPWGDEPTSCSRAIIYENDLAGCGTSTTHPVYSRPSGVSPYGVLSLAGNVEEWTNDRFGKRYYSIAPRENPTGPSGGPNYATRGGAFDDTPEKTRIFRRDSEPPSALDDDLGFRCAISLEP